MLKLNYSTCDKSKWVLSRVPFIRKWMVGLLIGLSAHAIAQDVSIIPVPVRVQTGAGNFVLASTTSISVPVKNGEVSRIASYLAAKIKPATGFDLKTMETAGEGGIQLVLNSNPDTHLGHEGYTLDAGNHSVVIRANNAAGLFYGVQTLLQLLPKEIESKTLVNQVRWQLPAVSITDYPRFSWRGLMLDVSRHFFTKEYVKEYIDQIARYKFNRFHWHLTDDNGWTIEIKSLPKLTGVGAWRVSRTGTFGSNTPPKPGEAATDGGFYTQEEIKEVVQYAKDRYIEVLPEIEMPGHSMAIIASYPELSCTRDPNTKVNPGSNFSTWFGNGKFEMSIDNTLNPSDEKVYQFIDQVMTEVAALFPFEYIHMGGDECYKGFWEKDPGCQAFMKKMNLKNADELQSYFSKRVTKIISDKKKKTIGWDEILEGGLAPGAAVMSWRGIKGGIEAANQKHQVVMSPAPQYYLDMGQGEPSVEPPIYGIARLQDVYKPDFLPAGLDSSFVLGGQGNLWTEQVPSTPQVEYMTYPRAFALAEVLWSSKSGKDWNNFVKRVEDHFGRFDLAHINYARSLYDPIIKIRKNAAGNKVIELHSEVQGLDFYYTIDNSWPNSYYPLYKDPIVLSEDVDMFRVISYKAGKPVGKMISLKTEDLEKRIVK